jgi:hypothetical protein
VATNSASSSAHDGVSGGISNDIEWTREESFDVDEDYVNVSRDAPTATMDRRRNNTPVYWSLMQEVRDSVDLSSMEQIAKRYLDGNVEESSLLLHFLFRLDVAVKTTTGAGGKGYLTQCISPHPIIPLAMMISTTRRRRVWTYYQQLNLRLRLGSATSESCHDALDMISQDSTSTGSGTMGTSTTDDAFPGIAKDCPVMGLMESPPNVHGVTYIAEEKEIYLGMNGRDFELYMVVSTGNGIAIKQAAALGAKLVRQFMSDEKQLFLSSPLTWRE